MELEKHKPLTASEHDNSGEAHQNECQKRPDKDHIETRFTI